MSEVRAPRRVYTAWSVTACLPLFLFTCCGGSDGPVDGGRAMAHVRHMVETIGPRPAGSEALARCTDYLAAELQKVGLTPRRHEFDHPTEKIRIRNLWTQIDGEDPKNGPILCIGAHYDTKLADGKDGRHDIKFVGAIDGAGATAVLLELARVLPQTKRKVNIWLYFIDGEESVEWHWKDERALLGSREFVKTMNADKTLFPNGIRARMKAFVLLDLIGDRNIKIDRDGKSSSQLQDLFLAAAQEMGEGDRMYKHKSEFKDDHLSFTDYGIPSVDLIDFHFRVPGDGYPSHPDYAQWWHTEHDTIDKMSDDALAFAGNLVVKALPAVEQFCLR